MRRQTQPPSPRRIAKLDPDRARAREEIAVRGEDRRSGPQLIMAKKKTYGRTASGKPITDELVQQLADKAEAGYDLDEAVRRRGGRPPIGYLQVG